MTDFWKQKQDARLSEQIESWESDVISEYVEKFRLHVFRMDVYCLNLIFWTGIYQTVMEERDKDGC